MYVVTNCEHGRVVVEAKHDHQNDLSPEVVTARRCRGSGKVPSPPEDIRVIDMLPTLSTDTGTHCIPLLQKIPR